MVNLQITPFASNSLKRTKIKPVILRPLTPMKFNGDRDIFGLKLVISADQ